MSGWRGTLFVPYSTIGDKECHMARVGLSLAAIMDDPALVDICVISAKRRQPCIVKTIATGIVIHAVL